jgi:hypothetical protein
MRRTTPPSPEQLYDGTIAAAWRLALCLHREPRAAQDALVRAYGDLARTWPADLRSARRRLLALLWAQAAHAADATPAA